MSDLPHTYNDGDGDYLRIGKGAYTAYDPSGRQSVSVNTPTGDDAVALARAVLAAAGDTGHTVISEQDHEGDRHAIHTQMENEARAYQGGRIDGARDAGGGLARRVADLEKTVETLQEFWNNLTLSNRNIGNRTRAALRRLDELEALVSDQATAIERQSRDIEDLRAAMGNAQAAIRGLGTYYTAEGDG